MRRRIDFVIPDRDTARQIENELLLARVEERRMHFLAKPGADLGDLPEATTAQKMDFEHGVQQGVVIGGIVGLVLALLVYFFMDIGVRLSFGTMLLVALMGGVVGVFASALVSTSVPNTRLRRFNKALESGQILLMVDVPDDRVDEITALVHKHHPEVVDGGVEPYIKPFP